MIRAILLAICLGTGTAQGTEPAAVEAFEDAGQGIPGLPPGPPPPPEQVDAEAHAISLTLRCPVCQGLSIADSTSPTARSFQRRVRELVAMGYTREQIQDYFVDRYGEFILGDPPARGLNWILWLAPALGIGGGISWAVLTVAQWRREPDEVPLPSDVGLAEKDPYEQRLLDEIDE